jgi:glycosyltransferase involved in cell wall biosynthesis
LKISIVTGFFLPVPAVGGGATEKSWHRLAEMFAAAGHSVTLVSRSWPGLAPRETVNGVQHVRLPGFNHTRRLVQNLFLDFIWGIRVAFALPPGDVVVCNTITLPVWLRSLRPKAGVVCVMIGRVPKGQVGFYGGVSRIYAPSTFVARQFGPRALARTKIIGYPIEWSLMEGAAARTGAPVVIGFVGRLHPEKGIELLVRAAGLLAERRGLPAWRLRLVGPQGIPQGGGGEEWGNALRSAAAAKLGDRVEWLPPEFDAGRLASIYGSIDVFCYPSLALKGETFGVAVAEAMASGCAVVVSALDCFSDLVADADTGMVFDHAAPDADRRLADCLERLVADAGLRERLARAGQSHARLFDYPEVSRNILGDLTFLTGETAEKRQQ